MHRSSSSNLQHKQSKSTKLGAKKQPKVRKYAISPFTLAIASMGLMRQRSTTNSPPTLPPTSAFSKAPHQDNFNDIPTTHPHRPSSQRSDSTQSDSKPQFQRRSSKANRDNRQFNQSDDFTTAPRASFHNSKPNFDPNTRDNRRKQFKSNDNGDRQPSDRAQPKWTTKSHIHNPFPNDDQSVQRITPRQAMKRFEEQTGRFDMKKQKFNNQFAPDLEFDFNSARSFTNQQDKHQRRQGGSYQQGHPSQNFRTEQDQVKAGYSRAKPIKSVASALLTQVESHDDAFSHRVKEKAQDFREKQTKKNMAKLEGKEDKPGYNKDKEELNQKLRKLVRNKEQVLKQVNAFLTGSSKVRVSAGTYKTLHEMLKTINTNDLESAQSIDDLSQHEKRLNPLVITWSKLGLEPAIYTKLVSHPLQQVLSHNYSRSRISHEQRRLRYIQEFLYHEIQKQLTAGGEAEDGSVSPLPARIQLSDEELASANAKEIVQPIPITMDSFDLILDSVLQTRTPNSPHDSLYDESEILSQAYANSDPLTRHLVDTYIKVSKHLKLLRGLDDDVENANSNHHQDDVEGADSGEFDDVDALLNPQRGKDKKKTKRQLTLEHIKSIPAMSRSQLDSYSPAIKGLPSALQIAVLPHMIPYKHKDRGYNTVSPISLHAFLHLKHQFEQDPRELVVKVTDYDDDFLDAYELHNSKHIGIEYLPPKYENPTQIALSHHDNQGEESTLDPTTGALVASSSHYFRDPKQTTKHPMVNGYHPLINVNNYRRLTPSIPNHSYDLLFQHFDPNERMMAYIPAIIQSIWKGPGAEPHGKPRIKTIIVQPNRESCINVYNHLNTALNAINNSDSQKNAKSGNGAKSAKSVYQFNAMRCSGALGEKTLQRIQEAPPDILVITPQALVELLSRNEHAELTAFEKLKYSRRVQRRQAQRLQDGRLLEEEDKDLDLTTLTRLVIQKGNVSALSKLNKLGLTIDTTSGKLRKLTREEAGLVNKDTPEALQHEQTVLDDLQKLRSTLKNLPNSRFSTTTKFGYRSDLDYDRLLEDGEDEEGEENGDEPEEFEVSGHHGDTDKALTNSFVAGKKKVGKKDRAGKGKKSDNNDDQPENEDEWIRDMVKRDVDGEGGGVLVGESADRYQELDRRQRKQFLDAQSAVSSVPVDLEVSLQNINRENVLMGLIPEELKAEPEIDPANNSDDSKTASAQVTGDTSFNDTLLSNTLYKPKRLLDEDAEQLLELQKSALAPDGKERVAASSASDISLYRFFETETERNNLRQLYSLKNCSGDHKPVLFDLDWLVFDSGEKLVNYQYQDIRTVLLHLRYLRRLQGKYQSHDITRAVFSCGLINESTLAVAATSLRDALFVNGCHLNAETADNDDEIAVETRGIHSTTSHLVENIDNSTYSLKELLQFKTEDLLTNRQLQRSSLLAKVKHLSPNLLEESPHGANQHDDDADPEDKPTPRRHNKLTQIGQQLLQQAAIDEQDERTRLSHEKKQLNLIEKHSTDLQAYVEPSIQPNSLTNEEFNTSLGNAMHTVHLLQQGTMVSPATTHTYMTVGLPKRIKHLAFTLPNGGNRLRLYNHQDFEMAARAKKHNLIGFERVNAEHKFKLSQQRQESQGDIPQEPISTELHLSKQDKRALKGETIEYNQLVRLQLRQKSDILNSGHENLAIVDEHELIEYMGKKYSLDADSHLQGKDPNQPKPIRNGTNILASERLRILRKYQKAESEYRQHFKRIQSQFKRGKLNKLLFTDQLNAIRGKYKKAAQGFGVDFQTIQKLIAEQRQEIVINAARNIQKEELRILRSKYQEEPVGGEEGVNPQGKVKKRSKHDLFRQCTPTQDLVKQILRQSRSNIFQDYNMNQKPKRRPEAKKSEPQKTKLGAEIIVPPQLDFWKFYQHPIQRNIQHQQEQAEKQKTARENGQNKRAENPHVDESYQDQLSHQHKPKAPIDDEEHEQFPTQVHGQSDGPIVLQPDGQTVINTSMGLIAYKPKFSQLSELELLTEYLAIQVKTISRLHSSLKPRSIVVFLPPNTPFEALAMLFSLRKFKPGILHSSQDKASKKMVQTALEQRKINVLLCTDHSISGMFDIRADLVVSWGVPTTTQYVSRSQMLSTNATGVHVAIQECNTGVGTTDYMVQPTLSAEEKEQKLQQKKDSNQDGVEGESVKPPALHKDVHMYPHEFSIPTKTEAIYNEIRDVLGIQLQRSFMIGNELFPVVDKEPVQYKKLVKEKHSHHYWTKYAKQSNQPDASDVDAPENELDEILQDDAHTDASESDDSFLQGPDSEVYKRVNATKYFHSPFPIQITRFTATDRNQRLVSNFGKVFTNAEIKEGVMAEKDAFMQSKKSILNDLTPKQRNQYHTLSPGEQDNYIVAKLHKMQAQMGGDEADVEIDLDDDTIPDLVDDEVDEVDEDDQDDSGVDDETYTGVTKFRLSAVYNHNRDSLKRKLLQQSGDASSDLDQANSTLHAELGLLGDDELDTKTPQDHDLDFELSRLAHHEAFVDLQSTFQQEDENVVGQLEDIDDDEDVRLTSTSQRKPTPSSQSKPPTPNNKSQTNPQQSTQPSQQHTHPPKQPLQGHSQHSPTNDASESEAEQASLPHVRFNKKTLKDILPRQSAATTFNQAQESDLSDDVDFEFDFNEKEAELYRKYADKHKGDGDSDLEDGFGDFLDESGDEITQHNATKSHRSQKSQKQTYTPYNPSTDPKFQQKMQNSFSGPHGANKYLSDSSKFVNQSKSTPNNGNRNTNPGPRNNYQSNHSNRLTVNEKKKKW